MECGVSIVRVWELAQKYAPGVCRKYNISEDKLAPEDLVTEFIIKFVKSKFAEKFDPNIRSLESYVHSGLVFQAISFQRRKDPAKLAYSGDSQGPDGELSILETVEVPDDTPLIIHRFMIKELVQHVPETRFGYGKVHIFAGKYYQSTIKSLVELALHGYSRKDLAKAFSVTTTRVGQLLNRGLSSLPREMVLEFLEQYA